MKFSDLPIGAYFRFHGEGERMFTTYQKTTSRGYKSIKEDYKRDLAYQKKLAKIYNYPIPRKLKDHKVGSVNASVDLIRRK